MTQLADPPVATIPADARPDVDGYLPAMSVVLVTPDNFATVRRTFRFVARQAVASELEVILVAPREDSLADMDPSEAAPFGRFLTAFQDAVIEDVDKSATLGIRKATAPVVALVEDHAYPEQGWAQALIAAHAKGDWAAVGSTVVNANPGSGFSWANQLMAYGEWTEPVRGGVVGNVSRHNVSFKKSALDAYGDDLGRFLGRAGGLLQDLKKKGHKFYLEPSARIRHANPSRWSSTSQLRFFAGRLSAATRARREKWPLHRKAVYFAGSPLIPAVRLFKMSPKLLARGNRHRLAWQVPAVAAALGLDAAGQMLGFLTGPGRTEKRLAEFEHDRLRHLNQADRKVLSDPTPPISVQTTGDAFKA